MDSAVTIWRLAIVEIVSSRVKLNCISRHYEENSNVTVLIDSLPKVTSCYVTS